MIILAANGRIATDGNRHSDFFDVLRLSCPRTALWMHFMHFFYCFLLERKLNYKQNEKGGSLDELK